MEIDKLPNDVLIYILTYLSLKESARTSLLARRWRYLWRFGNKILRFDHRDTATGNAMGNEKFKSWVNKVLNLHQPRCIDAIIIIFYVEADKYRQGHSTSRAVDSWVDFVMRKKIERLELNLSSNSRYTFPSYGVKSSPLCRLRSLRLVYVDIKDSAVHYFLGSSCPNLEELCIHFSDRTMNVRVMDPPCLRILEIIGCLNIESVEIYAANLVSLAYEGGKNSLALKKIPNLRELTISGDFGLLFVLEPKEHRSYSSQLEKLVLDFRLLDTDIRPIVASRDLPQLCSLKRLELQIFKVPGQSMLFFASLIEASPQLREFRIELSYPLHPVKLNDRRRPFPGIKKAKAVTFVHKKLKVVEMDGFIGCWSEKQLLFVLYKVSPSIERIVIDTESDYHGSDFSSATTRNEARKSAKKFVSKFAREIKCTVT